MTINPLSVSVEALLANHDARLGGIEKDLERNRQESREEHAKQTASLDKLRSEWEEAEEKKAVALALENARRASKVNQIWMLAASSVLAGVGHFAMHLLGKQGF